MDPSQWLKFIVPHPRSAWRRRPGRCTRPCASASGRTPKSKPARSTARNCKESYLRRGCVDTTQFKSNMLTRLIGGGIWGRRCRGRLRRRRRRGRWPRDTRWRWRGPPGSTAAPPGACKIFEKNEYCKQAQAEVVSNSSNKMNQSRLSYHLKRNDDPKLHMIMWWIIQIIEFSSSLRKTSVRSLSILLSVNSESVFISERGRGKILTHVKLVTLVAMEHLSHDLNKVLI